MIPLVENDVVQPVTGAVAEKHGLAPGAFGIVLSIDGAPFTSSLVDFGGQTRSMERDELSLRYRDGVRMNRMGDQ
jgi:hypothetical protein